MSQTIERVRAPAGPGSVQEGPPSPRRSVGTLLTRIGIAVVLVAAAVVAVLSFMLDTTTERAETETTPAGISMVGVPGSADAAERYLAELDAARPPGVPGSADAAERSLAELDATRPPGVPGSADAAERSLADQE